MEVAVRVSGSSPDATAAADGTSYMQTRLRSVASVAGLHSALRESARAAVVSEVPAPPLVHDAAYLVDRDRVPALVAEVDAYVASNPGLNVVCTGPWAPASFAGAA